MQCVTVGLLCLQEEVVQKPPTWSFVGQEWKQSLAGGLLKASQGCCWLEL